MIIVLHEHWFYIYSHDDDLVEYSDLLNTLDMNKA